jgi:hypothetical protein
MEKEYNTTAKGLMMWATSELEHVGRIASIADKDIQYSYAQSTINGMAHLKDAIFQYVNKYPDNHFKKDLLTVHDQVIRVMQHLKDVYNVNLKEIKNFNTHNVLSPLNKYLKGGKRSTNMRKKNRKTRKNTM